MRRVISFPSFLMIFICSCSIYMSSCTYDKVGLIPTLEEEEQRELAIEIKWTAFKFPVLSERVGVSGTFDNFEYTLAQNSTNIFEQLDGADIHIVTSSVNVGGNEHKTTNLKDHFFHYFTPTIECKILNINEEYATVSVLMNGISQNIILNVEKQNQTLHFSGSILDLNKFNAEAAFLQLDEICGAYHQGFVWPDVDLSITISNYDLLD